LSDYQVLEKYVFTGAENLQMIAEIKMNQIALKQKVDVKKSEIYQINKENIHK